MFKKILIFLLEIFSTAIIFVLGMEISDTYLCGTCVGILQLGGLLIAQELSKK